MSGNSRPVDSTQSGPHPSLEQLVRRHLEHDWRQPVAEHNRTAFEQCLRWRNDRGVSRRLLLDSGCGTARAARTLAEHYPDALVIGVDQSAARLARGFERFGAVPENLLLVRAECADIWRLMVGAGWQVTQHFLLYPNPWPKPGHLQRRWHGHPVFPWLLALGGTLEVRSNWHIYLQEMTLALSLAGRSGKAGPIMPDSPLTDFEDKYLASGHTLWQLTSCQD